MNPLEGLDADEARMLEAIAERAGISLTEARKRRDKAAGAVMEALEPYKEQLRREVEDEEALMRICSAMGLSVRGRWDMATSLENWSSYKKGQSDRWEKALKARWSEDEARTRVNAIIDSMAGRVDELGDPLPPSELWPDLFAEMDKLGLQPLEQGHAENAYYTSPRLKDHVTYAKFRKRIARARTGT